MYLNNLLTINLETQVANYFSKHGYMPDRVYVDPSLFVQIVIDAPVNSMPVTVRGMMTIRYHTSWGTLDVLPMDPEIIEEQVFVGSEQDYIDHITEEILLREK